MTRTVVARTTCLEPILKGTMTGTRKGTKEPLYNESFWTPYRTRKGTREGTLKGTLKGARNRLETSKMLPWLLVPPAEASVANGPFAFRVQAKSFRARYQNHKL